MIDTSKQEIGDVSNAQITSINGSNNTITTGLSYRDVHDICADVVRDQVEKMTQQSVVTFNERVDTFSSNFFNRISELEDKVEKLQEPAIQYSLRQTTLSCGRTSNSKTAEQLLDTLIDRIKAEEQSSEAVVADEAIQVLPKLSYFNMSLLGMLVFRNIQIGLSFDWEHSMDSISLLFSELSNIHPLDIACLVQTGCCSGKPSSSIEYPSYESILKINYDLYFSQIPSQADEAEITRLGNQIKQYINNMPLFFALYNAANQRVRDNYPFISSTRILEESLKKEGYTATPLFISELKKHIRTMTEKEISDILIQRNTLWSSCLQVMNMKEVRCLQLNPVGVYLGIQILKRECNLNYNMNLFY